MIGLLLAPQFTLWLQVHPRSGRHGEAAPRE